MVVSKLGVIDEKKVECCDTGNCDHCSYWTWDDSAAVKKMVNSSKKETNGLSNGIIKKGGKIIRPQHGAFGLAYALFLCT